MKNDYGFLPKSYRQPLYYRKIGTDWCAIYTKGSEEIHVQVQTKVYNRNSADSIIILRQTPTHRDYVYKTSFKTFKACMEALESYLSKS